MILEKKYLQPLPDINVKCEIYFVVHEVFYKFQTLKVVESHYHISLMARRYFEFYFHNTWAILSIPNMIIIVMKNAQVDFEVS